MSSLQWFNQTSYGNMKTKDLQSALKRKGKNKNWSINLKETTCYLWDVFFSQASCDWLWQNNKNTQLEPYKLLKDKTWSILVRHDGLLFSCYQQSFSALQVWGKFTGLHFVSLLQFKERNRKSQHLNEVLSSNSVPPVHLQCPSSVLHFNLTLKFRFKLWNWFNQQHGELKYWGLVRGPSFTFTGSVSETH